MNYIKILIIEMILATKIIWFGLGVTAALLETIGFDVLYLVGNLKTFWVVVFVVFVLYK